MKESPFVTFMKLAHAKGYREKVIGDDAYTVVRTRSTPEIKLLGAKGGKLQIREISRTGRVSFSEVQIED